MRVTKKEIRSGSTRKNIWLINHYAVPSQYYPLERTKHFAKHLKDKGYCVTVFAASTVHNSTINLITDGSKYCEIIDDGVHYVLINCKEYRGNGIYRILNMIEFALKLPGICKSFNKPDVVLATSVTPLACAMGVKVAKKYKALAIAEIADLWPESLVEYGFVRENSIVSSCLRKLEKWIYVNSDEIVFVSGGLWDYIEERGWQNCINPQKIHCINNGVDLEEFDSNRKKYKTLDEDLHNESIFKVVYTGSIRKVNNVGLLLDVAKQITDKRIKILVWGEGDEREALQQRIEKEKIANVVFKGAVEKKYIPYIVSNADLNIVHNNPSKLFRFGISFNKVFDYLAAGKPIFCDFPSKYNPVIECNAGIDINNSDPNSIANCIEWYVNMGQKAYLMYCINAENAAKEYDFAVLTDKLIDIIENVKDKE
ncbi:MAG: glycosyltransferase family 4 protein [Bacillaceae bacterium]